MEVKTEQGHMSTFLIQFHPGLEKKQPDRVDPLSNSYHKAIW
jgi:hypothetical protein